MPLDDELAQSTIKFVERHAPTRGDIVDLSDRCRIRHGCREQIGLHDVADVAEIAGCFAVAIDRDRRSAKHRIHPARNHGCVSTLGILTRAEDVEIAQANASQTVATVEHLGIQLVEIFTYRVGR